MNNTIQYFTELFNNNPLLNAFSLFLAILGIIFTTYFYFKSKKIRMPIYILRTVNLVRENVQKIDTVNILYAGNKVNNLSITKIAFWNDGKETINNSDVAQNNPIRLIIDKDCIFLDAEIIYQKNPSNDFNISISNDNKYVDITFDYFDFEEGIVLQVFHTLSIYNLIPSCSICNSSIKGNTIFRLSTHVHPYLDSTPEEPTFKFRYKLNPNKKWTIVIDNLVDPKEKNMVEAFKLEEIYSYHGELEAKDILLFKYQNSDAYLKYLLKNLLQHYKYTEQDVYRMFFCADLESKNNLDRPFSKLKRDILTQLGLLTNGRFKL